MPCMLKVPCIACDLKANIEQAEQKTYEPCCCAKMCESMPCVLMLQRNGR